MDEDKTETIDKKVGTGIFQSGLEYTPFGTIPRFIGGCLVGQSAMIAFIGAMGGFVSDADYEKAAARALIGAACYYVGDRMTERAYRRKASGKEAD